MWTTVLGLLCPVVGSLVVSGGAGCSLAEDCKAGDRRCTKDGAIEECTPHAAGVDVSRDPGTASHHDSSASTWEPAGSCGAGLCATEPTKDSHNVPMTNAFCTLSTAPVIACASGAGEVCDGTTWVQCHAGFDIARKECATCATVTVNGCKGAIDASCMTDKDCAAGLTCGAKKVCVLRCACPEGARCESCDAADQETVGPTRGASFNFICSAGLCARKYR